MVIDQDEIEALLGQAEDLAEETRAELPDTPPPKPTPIIPALPEVARILKIRVPVIVQLASRRMTISAVRKLSTGMIVEFYKSVEDSLELLINNHLVGKGDAVKVGEHFGLRIREIRDAATRIKSMGK